MAGAKEPGTMRYLGQLVKRARQPYSYLFQRIDGDLDNMIFLGVRDASQRSMPRGRRGEARKVE